jgi:hypothetical protein
MDKETQFLSNKTVATLGEDDFWTVICDVTAGQKEGEEPYDTRTISTKAIGKDLVKAIETASIALSEKFKELDFNLFNLEKEKDGKYFPYPLEGEQNSQLNPSS